MLRAMQLHDQFMLKRNPGAEQDLKLGVKLISVISDEEAGKNCRANLSLDVPWLKESPEHGGVALICGAAPSLKKDYGLIRKLQSEGATVFACNAAARILHAEGVSIDYQVILDARPETIDDIFPAKCHLMASIVPTHFFKASENPVLWHPYIKSVVDVVDGMDREFSFIGGGVTVALFSMCISYTMGFREIHGFGMDSSFENGEFYADGKEPGELFNVDVEFNGKVYPTTYDMKSQASVFVGLAGLLKNSGAKLEVHGSGLLPDVWKSQLLEETQCSQVI